jgi:ribosomal protein S6
MIGPTLNIVPLNATKTVAIISYPAEQQVAVKASLAKVFNAGEKTLKYELAKLVIHRVENFTLSPAHYYSWSVDKRARVLREFEASFTERKEIPDHADLNIFL